MWPTIRHMYSGQDAAPLEDVAPMWRHVCPIERMPFEVGAGEACTWCGEQERQRPLLRLVVDNGRAAHT
jgi:hypothetical protein